MKHLLTLSLALLTALTGTVEARSVAPLRSKKAAQTIKWLPKARVENAASAITLSTGDATGCLDGPDGSIWYYVANYDYETVEHEFYTEQQIQGYHFKVYDNYFNEVASIDDVVEFAEGETRVADVQLGPAVTRKFFNYDDKYEFMVTVMMNTSDFVNNIYTLVYSQGKEKPIDRIEGYYINALNTATDSWSENFYITFTNEQEAEESEIGGIMNFADNVFTIYGKAGYGGMNKLGEFRVPMLLMSGEDALPIITTSHNCKPYFAINRLKYSFYEDPYDWENENLTPDNEFIIDLYTCNALGKLEEVATTRIATENAEGIPFSNYYLGTFRYDEDIAFGKYTADSSMPAYVITRSNYQSASDDYTNDYFVYNIDGERILTLGENVIDGIFQSDVKGCDPQIMFIKIDVKGNYVFEYVNLLTGEVEHTLPYFISDEITNNANCDRVPDGKGGYLYVLSQLNAITDDEGNAVHPVGYVTPDGEVDHVDYLNLGQNVVYAECYISGEALNPFNFNTDIEREYMVLVKRLLSTDGSKSQEELLVVNPKETILQIGPDEELGNLLSIWISIPEKGENTLSIVYNNDYRYTMRQYPLPLSRFAGGSGTEEDPYQLATAGDLEQIASDLSAHYRIVADIDASLYPFRSMEGEFTGTLDGEGHIIKGLNLDAAIFSYVNRKDIGESTPSTTGIVRNITLVEPRITATIDRDGIIASEAMGGTFSGIRIYNPQISAAASCSAFGGIVGGASLYTLVEGCSLDNATVELPRATFGGIVGETRTSSVVSACAFSGNLLNAASAGGIVGELSSEGDVVKNCHVAADLTAGNIVGGIVGSSARGTITNCFFEGSLAAMAPTNWQKAAIIGGIVGELEADYAEAPEERLVVSGNLVKITALNSFDTEATPSFESEFDTVHSIVGKSSANELGKYIKDDAEGNPTYEDPTPDAGLADNYAVDSTDSEATADTVDGAAVALDAVSREWLETIGFIYGSTVSAPWSEAETCLPALWYEGAMIVADRDSIDLREDETAEVAFSLYGGDAEELAALVEIRYDDPAVAETESVVAADGGIVVTVKGLASGSTLMHVGIGGRETTVAINVAEKVSLGTVNGETIPEIVVAADRIAADGCRLDIYTASGVKVATGNGVVATASLGEGIYIVVATTPAGTRRSAKFTRR